MKSKFTIAGLILLFSFQSWAQNNLPYLGQTPPGLWALRFPPDSLLASSSWQWHSSPMFSYDGTEMYWTKYWEPTPQTGCLKILTMLVENNNWSSIHSPAFANTNYSESNSLYVSGDDTLYYYSDRPTTFINMVVRNATGWDVPQPLQIPLPANCLHGNTLSVAKNGDVYVDLLETGTNNENIYISKLQNGNYQPAQVLGPEINSDFGEFCPFIDPDGGYLIFGSNRPGGFGNQMDLYISFKNDDQTWTNAINMGYEINSTSAFFPFVTLDKQYLFFTTAKEPDMGYNPYWISASIIDTLHHIVGIDRKGIHTGQLKLYQNSPNPVHHETTFLFDVDHAGKLTFEIYSNLNGHIKTLFENEYKQKGRHSVVFDASDLPAGIYFYKLTSAEGDAVTGKMVVSEE